MKIEKLTIRYDKLVVLENINLTLNDTGLYVLMGNNGSGKSSFLKALCGLLKPSKGAIFFNKKPIEKLTLLEKSNIFAFADNPFPLPDYMTLTTYVQLGLSNDAARLGQSLNQFDLLSIAHQKVKNLSNGQQQRAMLAKVYFQNNPIWLLDEPTNFLDYKSTQFFWNFIESQSKKRLIICAAHHISEPIIEKSNCIICADKQLLSMPLGSTFTTILDYLQR